MSTSASAPRYLVTAVPKRGDAKSRRFHHAWVAARFADLEASRDADVEVLVTRPGSRPVAVKDRAALAAVAEGGA